MAYPVNACIGALVCEHGKAVSLNITSSDTLTSWDRIGLRVASANG